MRNSDPARPCRKADDEAEALADAECRPIRAQTLQGTLAKCARLFLQGEGCRNSSNDAIISRKDTHE
jgi:hypothetical protein